MKLSPIPNALHAEVFREGVIIAFSNGRSAIYSMALLHATFWQAEEIFDVDGDERAIGK